jgi:hypothetical protein
VQVAPLDSGVDGGEPPVCGDGIMSGAEECDRGVLNDDTEYGGCTTRCFAGPFCGDGIVNGPEECDLGQQNGAVFGEGGCTVGCTRTHYCGDGVVDVDLDEECDFGALNGLKLDSKGNPSNALDAYVYCTADCEIPVCCVF